MSGFKVNFSVNNQLATPSIHAAPFAQRPAAGQPGRVFIDTDNPSTGIYRDTGTIWIQIGAGAGALNLQNVTDNGNTTTNEITIGSATAPTAPLDVYGGGVTPDIVAKIQATSTNSSFIQFVQNGTARFFTGNRYKGGANLFIIGNSVTPQDTFLINNSSNNIAIGAHTDTPAYKLDIGGSLRSTQGANFATSSGNVGILTTSPTNLLTLVGSTTGRGIDFVSQANFALVTGKINYETTNDLFSIINASNWGNSALIFGTSNTERARFSVNGNFMVGTTTDSGNRVRINGSLRIDGQRSGSSGGASGQHLIIDCDGTTYKIQLLNP